MSPSEPFATPPSEYEKYRILREKWTHEDNLINHRLSWLLFSQSILFAAYAVLLTAAKDIPQSDRIDRLIGLFPFIGGFTIALISATILAALLAQQELGTQILKQELPNVEWPISSSTIIATLRNFAAGGLPLVFMIAWIVVAVV